ncbi:hypothetical protein I4U23_029854 [Adineta vaga]|nr:hypothetical protein I4U23_029854 [Adineta vaga]
MIGVDQKHTIGLMQQQEQTPLSSSLVHQFPLSTSPDLTSSIYDNTHHQKKFISSSSSSSSQIRLGLRCSCPLDDKQQQLFDEIFAYNEQTTNISERILDECIPRLAQNSSNTLIILSGQYKDFYQLQAIVLSSTLTRLCTFIKENSEKDLIIRINAQEFLSNKANVKNEKQLKYWSKIQRLFRVKKHRLKMSRERFDSYADSSSGETITNRNNEEIWIDGPLSSTNSKTEVWIDGPPEFCPHSTRLHPVKLTLKHRSNSTRQYKSKSKPSILNPKHPLLSSTISQQDDQDVTSQNFDTESVVSSHCHLPVLPVFKDHSLLPFRSHQTLPRIKPLVTTNSTKLDLRLSTTKLNDDMEALEKTLETLLIPSPIVVTPNDSSNSSNMSQSLNRIDQLSSSMSNSEKTKRLSRIVSPTRFEKLFSNNQYVDDINWLHPLSSSSVGSSVPNSPLIKSKNRQVRTPVVATPETPRRSVLPTKKSKTLPDQNRQITATHSRPSIFQRLFGLRSSSNSQQPSSQQQQQQQPISIIIESPPASPLISPLRVTLDSRDDLMPLTTSSTASSASGRASSSGYESMSNTVFEEIISSIPVIVANENNSIKLRNKSIRKDERRSNMNALWNSPILREKSNRQQRVSQLKHRQNELKLELAMTKTFLLMDKTKHFDYIDSFNSTINNSPMHTNMANTNEEDELERDIDHLERRLASAKSQLIFVTYQKNKQLKS